MTFPRLLAAFATLIVLAAPAAAETVKLGPLEISNVWSRATPPGAPTAGGYLTITNTGKAPDTLVSVASPIAGMVQIHEMGMTNGVMTMHPAKGGVAVPAGGTATLAPDGFHIMFMNLKRGLKEGEAVPVTLTFEKAGSVDTTMQVMAIGAKGPAGGHDVQGMGGAMKMEHQP
jgi:copper(I)-binding protein